MPFIQSLFYTGIAPNDHAGNQITDWLAISCTPGANFSRNLKSSSDLKHEKDNGYYMYTKVISELKVCFLNLRFF